MTSSSPIGSSLSAVVRKLRDPLVPIALGVVLLLVAVAFLVRDFVDASEENADDTGVAVGSTLVASENLSEGLPAADLFEGLVEARSTDEKPPVGAVSSQAQLVGQVLAHDVAAGEVLTFADFRPATAREAASVVVPPGTEGVALTLPFTAAGAGYVGAGDRVNVYSVVATADGPRLVLVETGVRVLDVSAEVAPYVGSAEGPRPAGAQLTLLLALEPDIAAAVILMGGDANFHLSLVDSDEVPEPRTGTITLDEYILSVRAGTSVVDPEPVGEVTP